MVLVMCEGQPNDKKLSLPEDFRPREFVTRFHPLLLAFPSVSVQVPLSPHLSYKPASAKVKEKPATYRTIAKQA